MTFDNDVTLSIVTLPPKLSTRSKYAKLLAYVTDMLPRLRVGSTKAIQTNAMPRIEAKRIKWVLSKHFINKKLVITVVDLGNDGHAVQIKKRK